MEITAQMIKEAYEKQPEIKPIQKSWFTTVKGQTCLCGLSALTASIVSKDTFIKSYSEIPTSLYIRETLGISGDFMDGFISGFDGIEALLYGNDERFEGFKVGTEARTLVFGDGATT